MNCKEILKKFKIKNNQIIILNNVPKLSAKLLNEKKIVGKKNWNTMVSVFK